jgi:catechol 2,3-dioxygenase-like lactoylglutathione lyase family enzyme
MDAFLGAVWLYSADVERSTRFYRDTVGLTHIASEGGTEHFDCGNIRLSIHRGEPAPSGFFVFIVDDARAEYEEMRSRGVHFESEPHREEFGGLVAEFHDPDGHELFIWELPGPDDEAYERERPLVEHYRSLAAALGRRVS